MLRSPMMPPHEQPAELTAFGYPWTPLRLEWRPTFAPHRRDQLLRQLDGLAARGFRAWWYAVATKGGFTMFPSRVMPHREDAVDYLPWLAEQAHARGIALMSWEYLCTAPLLTAKHPAWRWVSFGHEGEPTTRDRMFACHNSPYGQMLMDYCVEIVRDLGWDGVWFDGCFLYGHSVNELQIACRCDFCRAKYEQQSGERFPARVDFTDPAFRRYFEWRQHDFTEYWRALSGHVHEQNPGGVIVFNYFNRMSMPVAASGSPLRRMAGDAPEPAPGTLGFAHGQADRFQSRRRGPMHGMIATEREFQHQQTMLMAKTQRAINDNYPPEVWASMRDRASWEGPSVQLNPVSIHHHIAACATAGGYASLGVGERDLDAYGPALKELAEAAEGIGPYIGGEPVAPVGLVVSDHTLNYGDVIDARQRRHDGFWASIHGAHNLLNGLHLPSEVLLENMFDDRFLHHHQAVLLPEVKCLDDSAVDALTAFAETGGTVMLIGETGSMDALGQSRRRWAFDELLGVNWRDDVAGENPIDLRSPLLCQPLADAARASDLRFSSGLPERYVFEGHGQPVRCAEPSVEVLAGAWRIPAEQRKRQWGSQGLLPPPRVDPVEGAAIVLRPLGRGRLIFIAPNLLAAYATSGPRQRTRELIGRLLLPWVEPPIRTNAPANVAVTIWRQGDRTSVHLLNQPPESLWMPAGRAPDLLPEDVPPTGPIRLTLPIAYKRARSPLNTELAVETGGGSIHVRLPALGLHDVIVFE